MSEADVTKPSSYFEASREGVALLEVGWCMCSFNWPWYAGVDDGAGMGVGAGAGATLGASGFSHVDSFEVGLA